MGLALCLTRLVIAYFFKNSFEIVAYCFKIVARGSCVVFDKTGNSMFFLNSK